MSEADLAELIRVKNNNTDIRNLWMSEAKFQRLRKTEFETFEA